MDKVSHFIRKKEIIDEFLESNYELGEDEHFLDDLEEEQDWRRSINETDDENKEADDED